MKIAQIAPPWISVPPKAYGGIELVVSLLTEELVSRGHDVTLFATGDSKTSATLSYEFEEARTSQLGSTAIDAIHVSKALERAHEFDILHDHSGFLAVAFARFVRTPILHTLHGPFQENTKDFYGRVKDNCYFNAISEYQKSCFPVLKYVNTVYNAVDVYNMPYRDRKGDFLLMVSRVSAVKGTHLAIEVAKRAGRRIVIAGKVDPVDAGYFKKEVMPKIDGDRVVFLGEVTQAEKRKLMAAARCFVFPIQWPEPFGLVMAEAMATGTPVVAMKNGSVPEVVKDGETGFVVETIDEMVQAVASVGRINPIDCRRYVEEKFSPKRMADGYEQNYEIIIERERSVAESVEGPSTA